MSPCTLAFESEGFKVIKAKKDGEDILRLIDSEKPDFALIDLFLQKFDAIEVLQRMDSHSKTKCIVTSASKDSFFEAEALEAGAAYYTLKPYDPRILSARLAKMMSSEECKLLVKSGTRDLEIMITEIMHDIGVPAHVKGYQYVRYAIVMSVQDKTIINAVTKRLYPAVAQQFETTPSRVERAIRHAIEIAWDRGDIDVINQYFGYTVDNQRGKPTNSEFIALIADKIRLKRGMGDM